MELDACRPPGSVQCFHCRESMRQSSGMEKLLHWMSIAAVITSWIMSVCGLENLNHCLWISSAWPRWRCLTGHYINPRWPALQIMLWGKDTGLDSTGLCEWVGNTLPIKFGVGQSCPLCLCCWKPIRIHQAWQVMLLVYNTILFCLGSLGPDQLAPATYCHGN